MTHWTISIASKEGEGFKLFDFKNLSDAIVGIMTIKDRPLFMNEKRSLMFDRKLTFRSDGVIYKVNFVED